MCAYIYMCVNYMYLRIFMREHTICQYVCMEAKKLTTFSLVMKNTIPNTSPWGFELGRSRSLMRLWWLWRVDMAWFLEIYFCRLLKNRLKAQGLLYTVSVDMFVEIIM